MTNATSLPVLGGQYRCSQNRDGSWNIYDVPVFGEVDKGAQGNEMPVNAYWHAQTLRTHRYMETSGQYVGPLHVGHHDQWGGPSPWVRDAGFFRLTRVGKHDYIGKPMSTLFADFLNVPPDEFARIQAGKLPYCSVEISDYGKHIIKSVALLENQPPHFKFPLITVKGGYRYSDTPTSQTRGGRFAYLFRDWGKPMPGYGEDEDQAQGPPHAEPDGDEGMAPGAPPEAAAPPQAAMAPAPQAEPMPQWAQDLAQHIQALTAAVERMSGGGGQFADEPDPDNAPAMVDSPDMEKDEQYGDGADPEQELNPPGEGAKSVKNLNFADVARLQGEVSALKSKLRQREREDAKADRLLWAEDQLRGYNVSDEDRQRIAMFADMGTKPLEAFIDSYKENAAPDTDDEFLAMARGGGFRNIEPELQTFADKGPDTLATARALKRSFDYQRGRGNLSGVTFKEYAEANMPGAALTED